MAPGAISNFTILKVVGATFSTFRHCLLLLPLLPPVVVEVTPAAFLARFLRSHPSPAPFLSTRIVFTPSANVLPAKKFSFAEIVPCAAFERIPVTFAQLLYLDQSGANPDIGRLSFPRELFRSECREKSSFIIPRLLEKYLRC